jgi:hypothetical protein
MALQRNTAVFVRKIMCPSSTSDSVVLLHCGLAPSNISTPQRVLTFYRPHPLTLLGCLADAQTAIKAWRVDYNTMRPHSALIRRCTTLS